MSLYLNRRTLLGSSLAASALLLPNAVAAEPRQKAKIMTSNPQTIRLATINLSFYAVTAAIVQRALEAMGYQVIVTDAPHAEMYPRVAAGEFDLFTAAWLPTGHGTLWRAHKDNLASIGTLYRDASFFLAVPDSLPADIRSIADLARPDVAQRMNKTIQSIGAAAGITVLSDAAARHYGLPAAGYAVKPGQPAEWRAAIEAAFASDPWRVMPLWVPLFANRQYNLRILDDPDGKFGLPDDAHLVVPTTALARIDARTLGRLARIDLGRDAVSDVDDMVISGGLSPLAAADRWIAANRGRFDAWLA